VIGPVGVGVEVGKVVGVVDDIGVCISPGPITRGVNPAVTLVGANKHFCHRCRLYHLSSEANERQ
jgi:hypothetical protein